METSVYRKKIMGNWLRKIRLSAGLTQWDVAVKLDYTTAQFISNWERGVSLPPLEAVPTLAKILKFNPKEFALNLQRLREAEIEIEQKKVREIFKKSA